VVGVRGEVGRGPQDQERRSCLDWGPRRWITLRRAAPRLAPAVLAPIGWSAWTVFMWPTSPGLVRSWCWRSRRRPGSRGVGSAGWSRCPTAAGTPMSHHRAETHGPW